MNLILAKTKMCADKAGLALGLGFERVAYNRESKIVFTTPTTLEDEKSKSNVTSQLNKKKPTPQLTKKKPAPQPKRASQSQMRAPVREPRVTGSRVTKRRYHFTYFQREGHLVGFCFRRGKDERREWK